MNFKKEDYLSNLKDKIINDKPISEFISTGFEKLDKKISFYQNDELIIIGSNPNGGKSYFALNTVLNAIEDGKKIQYFLMSENPEKLISKLICLKFNLSIKNFQLGNYSNISKQDIFGFIDSISEYLSIEYDLFLDIYYIEDIVNMLSCADPKDLIVIDSLNYIVNDMDPKMDLIKRIKSLTHISETPIVLLVTINNQNDLRKILDPQEIFSIHCSSIYEYSNKILVLYSDERLNEKTEYLKEINSKAKLQNPAYKSTFINRPVIKMELLILKNTSGYVFNHKLEFSKISGRFLEV